MYGNVDMYSSMNPDMAGGVMQTLMAISAVISVVSIIICLIMLISLWKIFKKAGEPGVASIIPIWNTVVLFKITWGKWYYMFLMFVPIVNFVIMIITYVKLAKVFNKGAGFAVGLLLLGIIFFPMLAFGSAEYVGISGEAEDDYSDREQVPDENEDENEDEDDNIDVGLGIRSVELEDDHDLRDDLEMPEIRNAAPSTPQSGGRRWNV